ncbi:unnamed protein product [Moneuplotes crassus]|uniref:Uncharacterized protein n=1 Tax=Euplotes crassus TaxID=5936 RepID=A0AAD1ULH1_EUPCR|nr:unnamed protein product [Moneuplotes crassus]
MAQNLKQKIRKIQRKTISSKKLSLKPAILQRNWHKVGKSLPRRDSESKRSARDKAISDKIFVEKNSVMSEDVKEIKKRRKRADRVNDNLVYHQFKIEQHELKSTQNQPPQTRSSPSRAISDQSSEVKANFYKDDYIDFTNSFDIKAKAKIKDLKRKSKRNNNDLIFDSVMHPSQKGIQQLFTPVKRDRKKLQRPDYHNKIIYSTASKLRNKINTKINLKEAAVLGNTQKIRKKGSALKAPSVRKKPIGYTLLKKFTPRKVKVELSSTFVNTLGKQSSLKSFQRKSFIKKKLLKEKSLKKTSRKSQSRLGTLFRKYGNCYKEDSKYLDGDHRLYRTKPS